MHGVEHIKLDNFSVEVKRIFKKLSKYKVFLIKYEWKILWFFLDLKIWFACSLFNEVTS